jgi:hypothetical protein
MPCPGQSLYTRALQCPDSAARFFVAWRRYLVVGHGGFAAQYTNQPVHNQS